MKKFEHIFHKLFSKRSKPAYSRDVLADWKKIIIIFIILSLGVGGMSVYFFLKLNNGEIFTEGKLKNQDLEIINRKRLAETNEFYDKKAEESESILNAFDSAPIDPSL